MAETDTRAWMSSQPQTSCSFSGQAECHLRKLNANAIQITQCKEKPCVLEYRSAIGNLPDCQSGKATTNPGRKFVPNHRIRIKAKLPNSKPKPMKANAPLQVSPCQMQAPNLNAGWQNQSQSQSQCHCSANMPIHGSAKCQINMPTTKSH